MTRHESLLALLAVLAVALALQACGSAGGLPRCGSDADCGPGTACERPVSGEQGICVAPFAVTLVEPAPGAWVGQGPLAVRATLRVQVSGGAQPPSLDLLAGGAPAGTLLQVGSGVYQGTWTAPPGTPAATSLVAVAATGTPAETRSAPVAVRVDLEAPVFSAHAASCAVTPCVRDSPLLLQAVVTEPNLMSVTAALDLGPPRAVPLALVAGSWQATVDLGSLPFPALARDVTLTFTATDAAGNQATQALTLPVTRVRWVHDAGAPVTSPAVLGDGTLVVGVSAATGQVRALRPDGTLLWQATVGGGFVTAAPSVGPSAIWVASADGRIYALKPDGSAILNGAGCNTGGAVQGTPAVGSGATETVFAGSAAGRMYAADAGGTCVRSPLTDGFSTPATVDSSGAILGATTATATSTLRHYTYDGAFTEAWNVAVGVNVSAPAAIDTAGVAWTGSQDAKLHATTSAGVTTPVKTLGGSIVDSPIVLAGGDVVVGDQAKVLHRLHPDGTSAWATEPVLGGPVLAPLALAGGEAALLVPTAAGTLHAVAADGTVLWSGALTASQALREAAIQPPGAGPFGTAYLGSADGKVYAVIVEGHLDATAPWPKAHRDLRNTSNAAGALP